MSKEREAFGVWWGGRNIGIGTWILPESEKDCLLAWQACAAHYQPLLDAKDAALASSGKLLEKRLAEFNAISDENTNLRAEIAEMKYLYWKGKESEISNHGVISILQKENATLKALLERAREGLEYYHEREKEIAKLSGRNPCRAKAWLTLAAIDAATGEK